MDRPRSAALFAAAVLVLTIAAPSTAVLAADPQVTLRFAVVGGEDHPMARYARAFIDEVAVRSNGTLALEPAWSAGDSLTPRYEQGVAAPLAGGGADLALAASRAWDTAGVTSLQVLHAPLLMDDMQLAAEVAMSPTAEPSRRSRWTR